MQRHAEVEMADALDVLPSSSMMKSCKVGDGCLGGRKALRLLTKTSRPPGSGHGPMLRTP